MKAMVRFLCEFDAGLVEGDTSVAGVKPSLRVLWEADVAVPEVLAEGSAHGGTGRGCGPGPSGVDKVVDPLLGRVSVGSVAGTCACRE